MSLLIFAHTFFSFVLFVLHSVSVFGQTTHVVSSFIPNLRLNRRVLSNMLFPRSKSVPREASTPLQRSPPRSTILSRLSLPDSTFLPPSLLHNPTHSIVVLRLHDVTQCEVQSPCIPLSGGFNSGLAGTGGNASAPPPTWNLRITDVSKRMQTPSVSIHL